MQTPCELSIFKKQKDKCLKACKIRIVPSLQLHRVDNQQLYELKLRSEDQISVCTKFFPLGITLQTDLQKLKINKKVRIDYSL